MRICQTLIYGKVVEHWIWHSRKLAAPEEFVRRNRLKKKGIAWLTYVQGKPTQEEKKGVPPEYHHLVQVAPNGVQKTLYIASYGKRIISMLEKESTQLIKYLLGSDSNNPSFPYPGSLQGKDHKFTLPGLGRKTCNIFRMEEEG